jgi:hypothetical protein
MMAVKKQAAPKKSTKPTREDLLQARLKILDQLRTDLIEEARTPTGYDRFADGSFGRYGKSGF